MDNAKLKKYVTTALVASGVAITLPAFAGLLAPAILSLTAGILSDESVRKLGKDGVNYVVSIIGNLVAASLQKSPNLWEKSGENHDLLKLLAKAYSKAIEELLKEIEANPEYQQKYQTQAKLVLPAIQNRIDEALKKNDIAELEKLFPTKEYLEARQNTDEQNEKVPLLQKFFGYSPKAKVPVSKEFAGKLPSEDFILSIAEDTKSAKESLAAEVEISLRRWFAETTPSFDEFPKSLTPFVFERLAEIIPKYVGTLIKEEGFEKSWIAFQRSHLQAILKEVKNNKNGLSDEDRELLRPLAKELDKLAKSDFPKQLADSTSTILSRLNESEENIKQCVKDEVVKIQNLLGNLITIEGIKTRKQVDDRSEELKAEFRVGVQTIIEKLPTATVSNPHEMDEFILNNQLDSLKSEVSTLSFQLRGKLLEANRFANIHSKRANEEEFLFLLGLVSLAIGKADESINFHIEANKILSVKNDLQRIAVHLCCIGNSYLMKGDVDKALEKFKESIGKLEN